MTTATSDPRLYASSVDIINSNVTYVGGNQFNSFSGAIPASHTYLGLLPCVQADYDQAKTCSRNTRTAIIQEAVSWAKVVEENGPRIFWLYGMAGEGKTTIATTVACKLTELAIHGASFFFSRDFDDRSRPDKVIPSIVSCLSHRYPCIQDAVCEVLKVQPNVGYSAVTNQFNELLRHALVKSMESLERTEPIIIILDALDECGTEKQRRDLLSSFKNIPELPSVFKFFITSRPEEDIRITFDSMGVSVRQHDLSTGISTNTVKHDISEFIQERLKQIRLRYPGTCRPDDWPGPENIGALINQATRLFIWASTAMDFIEDEEVHDPNGQLEILLADATRNPVPESPSRILDLLYIRILRQAYTKTSNSRVRQSQRIVGAILTLRNPLSPSALGGLLFSPINGNHACDILCESLSRLRSVVALPKKHMEESQPVRIIHPSFADFLTHHERSHTFFLDPVKCHGETMFDCFKVMSHRKHAYGDASFQYGCRNWCYHLHYLLNHEGGHLYLNTKSFGTLRDYLCNFPQLFDSNLKAARELVLAMHEIDSDLNSIIEKIQFLPGCPRDLVSILGDILTKLRATYARNAPSRARLLTLAYEDMETLRLLPNSFTELVNIAREWLKSPPDVTLALRIPIEFASLAVARLVAGPYIYLTGEDSYQIAISGFQSLRVEIVDNFPPPQDEPPPPPPPVLEMPATFNLELVPGQHVAIDTTLFSEDLDMACMEDGTMVEGSFWGLLDIVHTEKTHKLNFSGTRLMDQVYSEAFLVNSRVMEKLVAVAKPVVTAAKCHLSILAPQPHYCDVTLSLSDSWTLGITWPPAQNIAENKVMYSVRVHPGGALQHFGSGMVTTTLYYEAIPDSVIGDPNDYIDPRNGFAMSFHDFIPHLVKVLHQLGMSLRARTNFINYNMSAFSKYQNIAYRFLSPRKIAAAIDIAVTVDSCVFTRLFLVFRGLTDEDVSMFAGAGEREASSWDWREIVGLSASSKDEGRFRVLEISVFEVT